MCFQLAMMAQCSFFLGLNAFCTFSPRISKKCESLQIPSGPNNKPISHHRLTSFLLFYSYGRADK